jgi:hypothetical protein
MDLNKFLRNNIVNIVVILLALIIANKINKSQNKIIAELKVKNEAQIKKNEVLNNISKLEKKIIIYKKALNKKDISLIINNLNTIGKEVGIKIISIKPESKKDYAVYSAYSFNLNIRAKDYHQVGKFIGKIETSPFVYIVDNFNVNPFSARQEDEEGRQENKVAAELRLSIISLKE